MGRKRRFSSFDHKWDKHKDNCKLQSNLSVCERLNAYPSNKKVDCLSSDMIIRVVKCELRIKNLFFVQKINGITVLSICAMRFELIGHIIHTI